MIILYSLYFNSAVSVLVQWCDQWCHNLSVSARKVTDCLPGDAHSHTHIKQFLYFLLVYTWCLFLPLQAKDERNYHIFYEMLAGLPSQQRQAFYLQEAETYYYLNQVEDTVQHNHQDGSHLGVFNSLVSSFFVHKGRGLWDNGEEWCRGLLASARCHGDPSLHSWRPVRHL